MNKIARYFINNISSIFGGFILYYTYSMRRFFEIKIFSLLRNLLFQLFHSNIVKEIVARYCKSQ